MNVSEKIRYYRELRGLTQQQLADFSEERAVLMMPMQNIWVSYVKRLMMQKWNTRQQNWDESMQVAVELSLIFRQLTVWM